MPRIPCYFCDDEIPLGTGRMILDQPACAWCTRDYEDAKATALAEARGIEPVAPEVLAVGIRRFVH